MKILIVYNYNNKDNLFVPLLYEKLQLSNPDIYCSSEAFWNTQEFFDIIHFQWPEEVVGWNCNDNIKIEKLQQKITQYKAQGTKFIYTCHNLCPHYSNALINKTYEIIEANSDMIVHMGHYSYNEFQKKYPHKQHIIIPHHIYENVYDETISKEEARRRLKIPAHSFVITAFGNFRNREESTMILKAFLHSDIKHKYLLAPRLYPFSRHPKRNIFKQIVARIFWNLIQPILNKIFHMQTGSNENLISNEALPYYLSASDIVIIQRKHILNSGNIPLAFLFRKVVIGPNVGNVGELLQETHNLVFNPNHISDITETIQKASVLSHQKHGETNYRYAHENLNLEKISTLYYQAYCNLNNK